MIVVDTGAMLALLDAGEDYHQAVRDLYEESPAQWILPWAILPEVDYLVARHLGDKAAGAFLQDLVDDAFTVEWGRDSDLEAAWRICVRYRSLSLGLVDAVVIAVAERLNARAIATLDRRHFGAVSIKGHPALVPTKP
jgi:predicted nucleic acid-binding protein